jgi:uncharacterized protein (TIGR01777 family)
MKAIVSGGTGFLGRQIVALLRVGGHEAAVYSRKPGKSGTYVWDPLAGEPPLESVDGMDAVFHLAGESVAQRWNPEIKDRIRKSRVDGTHRLVEAIAKARQKPKVLVCASGIGAYGDRGDTTLTEDSPRGTGFLADVCKAWEDEADRAAALGVRVVKIRIGFVLGHGGALDKIAPVFKLGLGGPLGSGNQWMPWVHEKDVARLFLHAAETEVSGVLNGVAPNPVTNAEFTRVLADVVHRPAFFNVPAFALKIAAGELGAHMLDSARVLPAATEKSAFRFEFPELRGALVDVLWQG